VSEERKKIVKAYGAELITSDPMEGSDGAIIQVRELVARFPDRYFHADQYNNEANWRAHYDTTGVEVWQQTNGLLTHFVAGVGTSGTLMGAGKRLKEYNPAIQLVEVQPADELQVIEGLKHMESAIVPGIYKPTLADKHIPVSAEDSYNTTRQLAREEGTLVGFSAGAAVFAARQIARAIETGIIVAVLPDGGDRYLSMNVWE
jgi:cysteine synthase B